jgi:hypothetical protein
MMHRSYSLGDIARTRYWISYESRPWAWWRWYFTPGPTYNGTTAGFVWALPWAVIIGHRRDIPVVKRQGWRSQSYRGWAIAHHEDGTHTWWQATRYGVRMRSLDREALAGMIDQHEDYKAKSGAAMRLRYVARVPKFTFICRGLACGLRFSSLQTRPIADLDGTPFQSYYCTPCGSALHMRTGGQSLAELNARV